MPETTSLPCVFFSFILGFMSSLANIEGQTNLIMRLEKLFSSYLTDVQIYKHNAQLQTGPYIII